MVSTRQMTTTGAPGGPSDDSFDVTSSSASASTSASTSSMVSRPGTIAGTTSLNMNHRTTVISPSSSSSSVVPKRSIHLLELPIEILDMIFAYVGYKNVSQMRLVSPKMNQICGNILNSTFQKLQTQTWNHFQIIKQKMPKRESARRVHPSASECDIIETCYMRLSLLEMTFGKFIDKKHICFFPGTILDEVIDIMSHLKQPPLGRPYKITEELFDLSTMAMEYFKDKLESGLPAIGFFNKDFLDFDCTKQILTSTRKTSHSSSMPSPPQSNMVLRKGIRKIKQGMKKYNNQLTLLRNDLRFCKRKSTEQTKQITEMQKLITEQQKQILEYGARLDENDKKNEEMSMKISTLLQESNKCKTELQYWRSKSPAASLSNSNESTEQQQQTLSVLANGDFFSDIDLYKQEVQNNDINNDLTTTTTSIQTAAAAVAIAATTTPPPSTATTVATGCDNTDITNTSTTTITTTPISTNEQSIIQVSNDESKKNHHHHHHHHHQQQQQPPPFDSNQTSDTSSVISCIGSPKLGKRKAQDFQELLINNYPSNTNKTTANAAISNNDLKYNDNKKARKVQNKLRCPSTSTSCKTRSK